MKRLHRHKSTVAVLDVSLMKKIIKSPTSQSFENISVSTDLGNQRLNLVTIYRLPGSCNAFFRRVSGFFGFSYIAAIRFDKIW